uniref:hypothetical protein n=1 Tax=Pseudomonas viridiflava TaxID=33069 RepID=UPI00197F2730
LVNRFFDVLTIQKGLTKLLIDIVAAAVLIFFSAILLSFYHTVFIGFGIFTILCIGIIILIYYRRGVSTSIEESEYKYEVVAYLESVAADLDNHRGNKEKMNQVMTMTDEITSKYI